MNKLNSLLVLGTLTIVAVPGFATPIAVDGTWYNFATVAGMDLGCGQPVDYACNYTSAIPSYYDPGIPPWTFTATGGGALLTVLDGGELGDVYNVWDMGVLIGTTSAVDLNLTPYACGGFPLDCIDDPNMSKGSFALAPGAHSITISIASTPYENSYLSWFKADPVAAEAVPEPKTLILMGAGFLALGMLRVRRRAAPGRR